MKDVRVMGPAIFLDRDGTLNKEIGYLSRVEDLVLLPGVPKAIRALNERALPAIVITNQSGIGRGYYTEAAMQRVHDALAVRLAREGCHLDGFYHCPHHPDAGCDCRKPAPGMLIRAARERNIDLAASFVVGDKITDLQAGQRVGCRTVLILTGYGAEQQNTDFPVDFVADDLLQAVQWIIQQLD